MKTTSKLITNHTGYGMLHAIVKHYPKDDHIKGRAMFYRDENIPHEDKLRTKFGEGSFFSAVLQGDVVKAINRANKPLRKAICQALIDCEIYIN